MEKVEILRVEANDNPQFVKTAKIIAKRGDVEFIWEKTTVNDSVHVVVFNKETNEFMFVRQVRVPVLSNDPSQDGVVYELCAGLVDKDKSLEIIALEEVLEELGYESSEIEHIKTLKSGVGSSGQNSHLFYCEVTEDMKVSEGGGLENEDIEVVRIAFDEIQNFLNSNIHTDAMTMFGIHWYLLNK